MDSNRLGIPDAWLVVGAQYRRAFDSKLEADKTAAKWGKVLPLYRGEAIPDHAFTGNAPGIVGADNCQICGVWYDEHPPRSRLAPEKETGMSTFFTGLAIGWVLGIVTVWVAFKWYW